ncbi:MAG: glycosyltransferase family 4 protein [Prevotellaceae bacterium]|nr:glycosyltransferase family 4 protein [Prevotellaceae bacterium]
MTIAYVITESFSVNKYNGIRVQAETWADELIRQGHNVIRISPWDVQEWEEYDVIHIIGPCEFLLNFTSALRRQHGCRNIVFSPIIDTIKSVFAYKMASFNGCRKLRLYSSNYTIRLSGAYIERWLARSRYEFTYINKAYSVPAEKISIVPLSFRIPLCKEFPAKEPFCLHVSKITDERKNMMRLIRAAVKYGFRLVLAGGTSSEKDYAPLRKVIEANDNVTYLGRVSDEQLMDLYKRAKVFALPSIAEGVGMVAVEAASCGCDIVVTKIGGPKEYYGDMAYVVSPYDVDEIGRAVVKAMETTSQPALMRYVQEKYNLESCVKLLVSEYKKVATK